MSITVSIRGHIIFPKRHFIESSFCQNAMFRIVVLPKKEIAESSHGWIDELAILHNAERHFSESLFNRTSFYRVVVQSNVSFTNRFGATSFSRNVISSNRRFAEIQFFRIVVLPKNKLPKVIWPNRHMAVSSN